MLHFHCRMLCRLCVALDRERHWHNCGNSDPARHSCVEYFTPRPKKRDEIMVFGGVLEVPNQDSEVSGLK